GAGPDGATPEESGLLELSRAHGSAGLRTRELRRSGAVARGRQRSPYSDRRLWRAARRYEVQRTLRLQKSARRPKSRFREKRDGEAPDVRPWSRTRILRRTRRPADRPRGGDKGRSLVVDHPGRRSKQAVPDANDPRTGGRCRRAQQRERCRTVAGEEVAVIMQIITKKSLPRRTFLRGLGVSLALPLLDSMVPAFSAAASRIRRLGCVYVPNGMEMRMWTPKAEGTAFQLSPILESLGPFRDQMFVLSGLADKVAVPLPGEGIGDHARASSTWLTGVHVKKTEGPDIRAGVSMDQLAAQVLGKETQLASLE